MMGRQMVLQPVFSKDDHMDMYPISHVQCDNDTISLRAGVHISPLNLKHISVMASMDRLRWKLCCMISKAKSCLMLSLLGHALWRLKEKSGHV